MVSTHHQFHLVTWPHPWLHPWSQGNCFQVNHHQTSIKVKTHYVSLIIHFDFYQLSFKNVPCVPVFSYQDLAKIKKMPSDQQIEMLFVWRWHTLYMVASNVQIITNDWGHYQCFQSQRFSSWRMWVCIVFGCAWYDYHSYLLFWRSLECESVKCHLFCVK